GSNPGCRLTDYATGAPVGRRFDRRAGPRAPGPGAPGSAPGAGGGFGAPGRRPYNRLTPCGPKWRGPPSVEPEAGRSSEGRAQPALPALLATGKRLAALTPPRRLRET